MSTGITEAIQNRATIQTALMGLLIGIWTPLISSLVSSNFCLDVPIENMAFMIILTVILLMFMRDDKRQEHRNAIATLTNPKILEQNLDRQASMITAQVESIRSCVEELKKINQEHTVIEKIVEVPVEKIVYVPTGPVNTTSDTE